MNEQTICFIILVVYGMIAFSSGYFIRGWQKDKYYREILKTLGSMMVPPATGENVDYLPDDKEDGKEITL